jgi:hypothetical protein
LNLYFLFAIYPIVTVFWFNQGTSKFYSEYWKQIITLLIQQPVFLFCFAIFVDMTIGISTNLSSLPNLLIYAVFLGFMTVVPPTLSARIFGDAFAMADHLGFVQSKNYIGQKVQNYKGIATNLAERGTKSTLKNTPVIAGKAAIGTGKVLYKTSEAIGNGVIGGVQYAASKVSKKGNNQQQESTIQQGETITVNSSPVTSTINQKKSKDSTKSNVYNDSDLNILNIPVKPKPTKNSTQPNINQPITNMPRSGLGDTVSNIANYRPFTPRAKK